MRITKNMTNEQQNTIQFNQNGNTNETGTINTDGGVTYHYYGRLAAKDTNSNPANIEPSLDKIYEEFLKEQQLNEDGIKQRILRLRDELSQKKNQKSEMQAKVISDEQLKEDKEKRIEELEIKKIEVKDGEAPTTDYVPFIIGTFIVILLTLYLFVFYSSSGYSALYGVKEHSLGFMNPNVFADAQNKGGGLLAMIILFPVIFLGLGFLIHDALDRKKYILIVGLLAFTLFVDSIIGYKISQSIYNNAFNAGLTNGVWKSDMIYSDINFYLVVALGFVVYVIWGALLHYVLNKHQALQPDQAIELRVDNLNRKIAELRQALAETVSKINILKGQISTIENEIIVTEKDIIGYNNGVIPVNIPLLQASVGDFMNGWFAYTTMMYPLDAVKRTSEAKENQTKWIENKIQLFKTDN